MKVFVAGCGRSGTTYLKTLLDATNDLFIPLETLCLSDYLRQQGKISTPTLMKMLYDEPQLKSWSLAPKRLDFDTVAAGIDYIHSNTAEQKSAKYWGQKTPRFVNEIELFDSVFSDIKWILIYRDPRAVVSSMLSSKRHTYSVAQAVSRWRNDNQPILKHLQNPKKNIYILSYEELVADINTSLKKIFDFIGIPMPSLDQIYNYDYGKEKSRNFKGFRFKRNEIREGLVPNSAYQDSWKTKLTPSQITYIEEACAQEMQIFLYTKLNNGVKPTFTFKLKDQFSKLGFWAIVYQYLKNWPEYLIKSQKRKVMFNIYRILE